MDRQRCGRGGGDPGAAGVGGAVSARDWTPDDVRAGIVDGTITRERACDGKKRFQRFEHVEKAKRDIKARHNEPDSLRTYACPFCGGWHFARARRAGRHGT